MINDCFLLCAFLVFTTLGNWKLKPESPGRTFVDTRDIFREEKCCTWSMLAIVRLHDDEHSSLPLIHKLEISMNPTKSKAIIPPYLKSNEVKELENLVFDYLKARKKDVVKKYYSDATAPGLEKMIIIYTFLKGHHAEKVTSMGRQILDNGNPVFVRNNNTTGQADLSLIVKGKAIKVEVKCKWTKDRYQNQAQKRYQKKVESAGGIYLIIRDFAQFKYWFDNYTS